MKSASYVSHLMWKKAAEMFDTAYVRNTNGRFRWWTLRGLRRLEASRLLVRGAECAFSSIEASFRADRSGPAVCFLCRAHLMSRGVQGKQIVRDLRTSKVELTNAFTLACSNAACGRLRRFMRRGRRNHREELDRARRLEWRARDRWGAAIDSNADYKLIGIASMIIERLIKGRPKRRTNMGNDQPVNRTSQGLRDALFDEIDALRSGTSNAARARSVAMLANSVLQSVTAEIEYHKYVSDVSKGSAVAKLGVLELGTMPGITLGTREKA